MQAICFLPSFTEDLQEKLLLKSLFTPFRLGNSPPKQPTALAASRFRNVPQILFSGKLRKQSVHSPQEQRWQMLILLWLPARCFRAMLMQPSLHNSAISPNSWHFQNWALPSSQSAYSGTPVYSFYLLASILGHQIKLCQMNILKEIQFLLERQQHVTP